MTKGIFRLTNARHLRDVFPVPASPSWSSSGHSGSIDPTFLRQQYSILFRRQNYNMAAEILKRIPVQFEKAKESGNLLFYDSTTQRHADPSGLNFQIRVCPALQLKPKLPTPDFDPAKDDDKKKFDPFAPPYVPDLYVGDLKSADGEDYVILLNKYSVVPEHFLLVTKEHQSQQSPLFPPDLVAAYSLLVAARRRHHPFWAFYNCGDLSGASQHHKHIQFMPYDEDDFEGPPIEQLAKAAKLESPDRPFTLVGLPYANHVVRLPTSLPSAPADEQAATLSQCFISLLDLAISTIRHDENYPAGRPSYNVILTLEHLYIIPRKLENAILEESGDQLSVNSCGFAGQLLVKSEKELQIVIKQGPSNILKSVALESVHEVQVEGTSREEELF